MFCVFIIFDLFLFVFIFYFLRFSPVCVGVNFVLKFYFSYLLLFSPAIFVFLFFDMPGYFRRGRNPSNPYGRRYWRRTGWWRRFPRSYRNSAFTSGRRRMSLRVPVEAQVQFTIPAGANWSGLACIQPYLMYKATSNARNAGVATLISSPLYRQYCGLYDQVKIDSVSVSGSVIDGIGIGGTFSSLSFASAWDRQVQPKEVTVGGEPGVTSTTIQYGSEAQTFLLTNNSRQLVHRWNRASDVIERSTFHDCTYRVGPADGNYAYIDDGFYPVTPTTSVNIGYVPGLWMAFYSPLVDSEHARYVNVTFKVIWKVTFRNPKYGLAAEAASKGVGDISVEPVKVEGAGKSVAKTVSFDAGAVSDVLPAYSGLLGDVVDRLSANMHEEGVYSDGEYDHDEDIQFGYEKLGDEVFHQLFKNVYDDDLKKFGLIGEKEVSG